MRRQVIILAAALCLTANVFSQNSEFRNAIHAKVNAVDYGMLYNGSTRLSQGFEVGYFRNIARFLNLGAPFKMAVAKLPGKNDNTVTTSLDLVFHIENIRPMAKFSPYLMGGVGLFSEAFKDSDVHLPFGVGLNYGISKYAFINFQGEFRKAMKDDRDNMQFGIGFVYLLHKELVPQAPPPPPDMDGDSIPDLVDNCPELKGLASALGCPDKDGDGLGDNEDKCPDQKGSLETEGCPDADGDAIADADDKCPTEKGTLLAGGCPDSDSDGVADNLDKCPTVAGTVDGCPDTDRDGFADQKDECPNEAGRWNGCPDTDFDGVADKDDKCPNDPGNAANKGCPEQKDSDGDGILDNADKCPEEAGAASANGCPDKDGDSFDDKNDPCPETPGKANGCPDADEDGIADKDDKCPNAAGKFNGCPDSDNDGIGDKDDPCPETPGKFGGCPDSDSDGVADNLDKCPKTPGAANSNGCPEIKQETKERLAFATKMVQFETGKATLKMESYAILDELHGILKQYPDYKLAISGHTDDVGDNELNLQLSRARAKACYDYLIFRGIPDSRIRHAGFGEMRPIAGNSTVAGKEMNRRVEFELVVE